MKMVFGRLFIDFVTKKAHDIFGNGCIDPNGSDIDDIRIYRLDGVSEITLNTFFKLRRNLEELEEEKLKEEGEEPPILCDQHFNITLKLSKSQLILWKAYLKEHKKDPKDFKELETLIKECLMKGLHPNHTIFDEEKIAIASKEIDSILDW